MKVVISDLKRYEGALELKDTLYFDKETYKQVFSLNEIKKVNVIAKCSNYGNIIEIELSIKADLILQCSYSLEDVDYKLNFKETLDFSYDDIDDEIFEIQGNEIELDEYVLSLIIAHIPLRVKKSGAETISVKGVKVISEDDFNEQEKEKLDPRLAALDAWEE